MKPNPLTPRSANSNKVADNPQADYPTGQQLASAVKRSIIVADQTSIATSDRELINRLTDTIAIFYRNGAFVIEDSERAVSYETTNYRLAWKCAGELLSGSDKPNSTIEFVKKESLPCRCAAWQLDRTDFPHPEDFSVQ
jgi:hypothetical protein